MGIELTTDDVVDAFCNMLSPGVKIGVLPNFNCNKYGIDVLTQKKHPSMIMFHFVTLDELEVELVLDLMELQRRGKEYLDHLYGLLCDQTMLARKKRQEANTITILNTDSWADKLSKKELKPKRQIIDNTTDVENEVIH